MAEKVLIACVHYDNGEEWEDHYSRNDILGVFRTHEGVEETFEKHIEALGKHYKRVRPNKNMSFWGCLGDPKNPTEFYFYAMYKATKRSQAYDNSRYTYYYLVKEVCK